MPYDTSKLTDEERAKLEELLNKASVPDQSLPNGGEATREWGKAPMPNPEAPVVTRLISPENWVDRQIGNLEKVGETEYKRGILAPKDDPIKAGIAAEGRFANAMKEAIENETRKKGLEKTNIDNWYYGASDIGAARLVDGVKKRRYKVEGFVSDYRPKLAEHLRKIDDMKIDTWAERKAKMVSNAEGLIEIGKARKGIKGSKSPGPK